MKDTKEKPVNNREDSRSYRYIGNQKNIDDIVNTDDYRQRKVRNDRLVREMNMISESTRELLSREHKIRDNRHTNNMQNDNIDNLLHILDDQKRTISSLKEEIRNKQKNIDNVYNYSEVVSRENELKDLKRQLMNILEEKQALKDISKQQQEEIKRSNILDSGMKQEINDLNNLLHKKKDEYRVLQEDNKTLDKKISDNHNILIVLKKRYQEYKSKSIKSKQMINSSDNKDNLSDLNELEDKYNRLSEERASNNRRYEEEKREYDTLNKQLKHDNIRTNKILEDRNKDIILNNIKLKKLKKLNYI